MKSLNGIIRKDLRVESIKRAIALAQQDFVAAKKATGIWIYPCCYRQVEVWLGYVKLD